MKVGRIYAADFDPASLLKCRPVSDAPVSAVRCADRINPHAEILSALRLFLLSPTRAF